MKHHQPASPDSVLHLAYLPGADGAFVLQLITKLRAARNPKLREALAAWPEAKLKDYGLAVSTKLAMLSLVGGRVYEVLAPLYAELGDHGRVQEHIKGGYGWITADRRLPYEILLEVDCFLFEFRSCYEILGHFLGEFFPRVLGQRVDEQTILATLGAAGIDLSWVDDLKRHRILFFHETAPWLAVSVDQPMEGDRELLILHGPNADPTDAAQCLTFSRLRAMYSGLDSALTRIHEWLLSELALLDAPNSARGP